MQVWCIEHDGYNGKAYCVDCDAELTFDGEL